MTRGLSGLRLWTAAGEPVKLPFLGDGCTRAVFSPDGSRVAAAGPWGIWLWSPEAENLAAQRLPQSAEVRSLALNSNGTRLATYSSDKSLLIWDTTAGKVLGEPITCRVPLGSQSYPRLTFSPDGERLVIDQTNADLIDVNSRKTVDVQHDNRSVAAALAAASRSTFDKQFAHIAFRPDGRVLATCGRDHTVRTWDAATLKPLGPVLKYSPDAEAEFSPDGNLLLVRAGGYMQLWDYKNDKTLGQKMPVSQKTLWIANNSLLTARGGVFLWNVATGHLARPPIGQRQPCERWRSGRMTRRWPRLMGKDFM